MSKAGRNDLCPCGSGKKYKKCCAGKQQNAGTNWLLVGLVAAAVAGALALGFQSVTDEQVGPGPGRVWSPEHGHYH
ncbi:MAG: SEC-C metal-binding domain-containing protein [Acidobacteriota bacterium]